MDLALEGAERHRRVGHASPATRTDLTYRGPRHPVSHPPRSSGLAGAVDLAHPRPPRAGQRPRPGGARPVPRDGRASTRARAARWPDGWRARAGSFDGIAVPRYAGDVGWDEKGVHVRGLEAALLGGPRHVRRRRAAGARPGRAWTRSSQGDRRGAAAARYLFDLGQAGLGAGATGEVSAALAARPRARADRHARPGPRAAATTGARRSAGASCGAPRTARSSSRRRELRTPARAGAPRRAASTIDRDDRPRRRGARARDLAAARRAPRPRAPRPGRGRGRARRPGAAPASSRAAGGARWPRPSSRAASRGEDVAYLGVPLGPRGVGGRLDAREVRPHSLVAAPRRAASSGSTDAWRRATSASDDAIDAARALDELAGARPSRAPWAGTSTCRGPSPARPRSTAGAARRTAAAHLASAAGRYYGVPYEDLDLARRPARPRHRGHGRPRAASAAGRVDFRGTVTDDGIYDGRAHADGVDVAALVPRRRPPCAGAAASRARCCCRAPWPVRASRATSARRGCSWATRAWARCEGRLAGDGRRPRGRGRALPVAARRPRRRRAASAWPRPTRPTSRLTAERDEPRPVPARVRGPSPRRRRHRGRAASDACAGRSRRPRALTAEAEVARPARVRCPTIRSGTAGPLAICGSRDGAPRGRGASHLAGEGTDLAVAGTAALVGDGARRPRPCAAAADLRALSLVAHGAARPRRRARSRSRSPGRARAPVVDGTLDVEGGGVRAARLPARRRGRARAASRFDGRGRALRGRHRHRRRRAGGAGGPGRLRRRAPHLVRRAGHRPRASPCAIPRACAACSTPTCASSATTPSSG